MTTVMRVDDFVTALERTRYKTRIWHAAQLSDFETYARHGRVLTRAELFDDGNYTPFDSDDFDVRNDIDQSVFANLTDQGLPSKNGNGVPNVYGPITLKFRPSALRNGGIEEVIVRRSAVYTSVAQNSEEIKSAEELIEICDGNGSKPEIQLVGGVLDLRDLEVIIVNDVQNGLRLIDEVAAARLRDRSGILIPVQRRPMSDEGAAIYAALIEWAKDAYHHNGEVESLPPTLWAWFERLRGEGKRNNVPRFGRYTYAGTLRPLRSRFNEEMWDERDDTYDAEYETYDDEDDYDYEEYDYSAERETPEMEWYEDGVSEDDALEEASAGWEPATHDHYPSDD